MAEHQESKRLKLDELTNFKICIVCQKPGDDIVKRPASASYQKLKDCLTTRASYLEPDFVIITKRLTFTAAELEERGATWHRKCYQLVVHSVNIELAKKRYEKGLVDRDTRTITTPTVGRPRKVTDVKKPGTSGSDNTLSSDIRPFTRSAITYQTERTCIFCDTSADGTKGPLHEVSSFDVGAKIKKAVDASNNDKWKVRLQPISSNDARAIDIVYHTSCYITNVLRRKFLQDESEANTTNDIAAADIEFFNILSAMLSDGCIIAMDVVLNTYESILEEHNIRESNITLQKLKTKIQDAMNHVDFSQPNKNRHELICSKKSKANAVKQALSTNETTKEMQLVFQCAKVLRRHILENRKTDWEFDGTLDVTRRSEHVPMTLYNLIQWITVGSMEETDERSKVSQVTSLNLSQSIMYKTMSYRQTHYTPKSSNVAFKHTSEKHENEHVVAVALKVHAQTGSKRLINFLHSNNVSVNYNRVMRLENQLAEAVVGRMNANGGLFLPSGIRMNQFIFFAVDNLDFSEDTPDEKNTTHGTVMVVFQQKNSSDSTVPEKLQIVKSNARTLSSLPCPVKENTVQCTVKGNPKPKTSPKYEFVPGGVKHNLAKYVTEVTSWLLARSLPYWSNDNSDDDKVITSNVPNFGGYNSAVSVDSKPVTDIHVLPLISSPPTEWQTLLNVLKQTQYISAHVVGPDKKVVITLDLDLYSRALKLQSLTHEGDNWILRIGELHTVLCIVRALGSLIENSGLDDSWIESDIYGPTTTRQILEGKHMKRAVNAHAVTLEVLFGLLMEELGDTMHPKCTLQEAVKQVQCSFPVQDPEIIRLAHKNVISKLEDCEFSKHLDSFCKIRSEKSPTFKFSQYYMKMSLHLLLFIMATRLGLWHLHLAALEELCPLLFTENRIKYAQLVPEYLAKMRSLETTEPEVWKKFENGNFCVRKSEIPFTSIGVDHALEQENRTLKATGGIRGKTLNPQALAKYFLIAPELSRLSRDAETMCGYSSVSKSKHHNLTQAAVKHHDDNVRKLRAVLQTCNPFKEDSGELVNVVTNSIMPENVRDGIVRREDEGRKAFETFVSDRITGNTNLWNKMMKMKLLSWKSAGKVVTVEINRKVMELKENRSLFARMAMAAKSRPDIDIRAAVGTYEFSTICRALFATDGSMLPCNDKSKLLHLLEESVPQFPANTAHFKNDVREEQPDTVISNRKAIIIDAMVLVQQISGNVKTCNDLAQQYLRNLNSIVQQYDAVHLVFDHYTVDMSLKTVTRNRRRGKGTDNRAFICTDSTPIRTELSAFLCNTKTKASLTQYLSTKVLNHYDGVEKVIVVSTETTVQSNHMDANYLKTCHEEADTILIYHAIDAAKLGYIVHILSPDTDVFILALRRYPLLGTKSHVITGIGTTKRIVALKPIYDHLGAELVDALPGFHSFTGCDTTGRFNGKGKLTCWRAFLKVEPHIIEAFAALGKEKDLLNKYFSALEEFVCQLYRSTKKITNVKDLRWHMFKRQQAESESLPPTQAALKQHTLRAHYQAFVWANDIEPMPDMPPPELYGWKKENNCFVPVITDLPPAPDAIIELTACGCNSSMCQNGRCSCVTAQLPCTEMCKCEGDEENCMNSRLRTVDISDGDSSDYDD